MPFENCPASDETTITCEAPAARSGPSSACVSGIPTEAGVRVDRAELQGHAHRRIRDEPAVHERPRDR